MEEEIASGPTSILPGGARGSCTPSLTVGVTLGERGTKPTAILTEVLDVSFVDSASDVHGTSNPGYHLDPPFDEVHMEIPCETDLQARLQGP